MLGRIGDAVKTLLHGGPSQAESRFRRMEAEARALIVEVNDVLEKLSTAAAREAKRRSRQAKQDLDDGEESAESELTPDQLRALADARARHQNAPEPTLVPNDPAGRAAWKAGILARMRPTGTHSRSAEL